MTSAVEASERDAPPAVAGERLEEPPLRATLGNLALLTVVLAFGAIGLRPLADPDLGWHLRTGELVLHSGFTRSDPWSFASSQPWVLHEWGGEVLMYLSYLIGGYHGLIVLHVILMLVLATLLVVSCRRVAGPAVALVVSCLALETLWSKATERPQLISFCILAAVLPLLRRYIAERRVPWWLIPVTYVWANVHAMWPIALALYAALVLGLVLETGIRSWRSHLPFLLVGVLSGLVVIATPNGPALLNIFQLGGANFIGEFGAPSILRMANFSSALLAAIIFVGWAFAERRAAAPEVAFVLSAVLLGSMYNRSVPVAAIALAPLAARELAGLIGRSPAVRWRPPAGDWIAISVLAVVFVVAVGVRLPSVAPLATDRPFAASRELDALPGRARVLNEYIMGGWLVWTARDTSLGIDGRSEVYGLPYVKKYLNALRLGPGWEKFVAESRFDAAYLNKDTPLVFGLKSMGWRIQDRLGNSVILLPPRG